MTRSNLAWGRVLAARAAANRAAIALRFRRIRLMHWIWQHTLADCSTFRVPAEASALAIVVVLVMAALL